MTLHNIVDTGTLADHLSEPALVVVDCRFDLADDAMGQREYAASHIPGAVYASLARDLSGEKTGRNGRHPQPDPAALVSAFGRLGIDASTEVVAYDQDNGMYASRLWWLLRWLGHDAVAVLDGGFARWQAERRPVRTGIETATPRAFSGAPRAGWMVNADEVARVAATGDALLLDARSPERFRGEGESLDRVAGHIPGSLNHFFKWNLSDEGTFRTPEEIRERLRASVGDLSPERIICYCGSGVTACHNLLALEHAGLGGSRLYMGSWSEWSADPSRPIQQGDGGATRSGATPKQQQ
jgi:thiosulfate/3-mercaptopyruvate sulfurtransferase